MAGAIEKKKNETYDELVGSPTTHIDARSQILSDIALSREFSQTYLQALCTRYGSNPYYTLNDICQNLAKHTQRAPPGTVQRGHHLHVHSARSICTVLMAHNVNCVP